MSKNIFVSKSVIEAIDSQDNIRGYRSNIVHVIDEDGIVWALNTKNKTITIIDVVEVDSQGV